MASRAQRAVPDVTDPEAWRRFGRALRDWREDVLGYDTQTRFAAERSINLKLVRILENAYRPGTYIKESMKQAARAYGVTYESMVAFLRGEADTFVRAEAVPATHPAPPPNLPPPPESRLVREDEVRPYADPIWEKLIELRDRGVPDPSGAQLGLAPFYAKVWDDSAGAMLLSDRVWLVGTVLRNAAVRDAARQPDANSA